MGYSVPTLQLLVKIRVCSVGGQGGWRSPRAPIGARCSSRREGSHACAFLQCDRLQQNEWWTIFGYWRAL